MSDKSDGVIIIFSSPSGAGKTTLVKLLEKQDDFSVSVSHTTRKARPNEVDGVDYHFVSKDEFKELINKDAFYEHSQIFGNFYGTSKSSVNKIIKDKFNVLFDIDWKGARKIRSNYKKDNIIVNDFAYFHSTIVHDRGVPFSRSVRAFLPIMSS